jgi:hypothetical protein
LLRSTAALGLIATVAALHAQPRKLKANPSPLSTVERLTPLDFTTSYCNFQEFGGAARLPRCGWTTRRQSS